MVWETLPDAVPTTADQFGGQYLNRISQLLTGNDIAALAGDNTLKPLIGTDWTFKANRLYVQSTDTTHTAQLNYSGTTNQTFDLVGLASSATGPGHVIYKVGSTYYARDGINGAIDYSGSVPETVIQSALSDSGSILVAPGQYSFSASFAGITVATNNHVRMSRNSVMSIPVGYTGPTFKLLRRTMNSIIEGGWLNDPSITTNRPTGGGGLTTPGTFIGIQYDCEGSPAVGQSFNIVKDVYIENAAVGLDLKCDVTSASNFISSNTFQNIFIMTPNVGVQFENVPGTTQNSVTEGLFSHIVIQSGNNTTNGFKDINGWGNVFLECMVWDVQNMAAPAVSFNVTSFTTHPNYIIGGLVTQSNFSDLSPVGAKTVIIDGYNGNFSIPDEAITCNSVTAVKKAQTGVAETVATFQVADGGVAGITIKNNTTTDSLFAPKIESTSLVNTQPGLDIRSMVNPASDTGAIPLLQLDHDLQGANVVTRPLLGVSNHGSYIMYVKPGGISVEAYEDIKSITAPASPSAGYSRVYAKAVDSNNDGIFALVKQAGSYVEIRIA